MQAPTAEVQAVLEVHSEVDEGTFLWQLIHFRGSRSIRENLHPVKISRYTIYVVCIVIADCPTVLECIRFPGRQRTINIPQEIGTKYCQFGTLLLNDPNGARVSNIGRKHSGDAEQINTEILREWATGRGKNPVTWETMTRVLHDIELSVLASEIEVIKLKPTISTTL